MNNDAKARETNDRKIMDSLIYHGMQHRWRSHGGAMHRIIIHEFTMYGSRHRYALEIWGHDDCRAFRYFGGNSSIIPKRMSADFAKTLYMYLWPDRLGIE